MSKIVILGAGHVGSHCALNIALKGICNEIILLDIDEKKADAQAKDISDATVFMERVPVIRFGGYEECNDADIVINAIGVSRKPGQTRLDLLDESIDMMKDVIGHLNETTFSGHFISITNPCDSVVNYARKHLNLPQNKIFGTGTSLDTARLRVTLHKLTGISPASIQCIVMGEHGDSSMIPMSAITLLGKPLVEWMKENPEKFSHITEEVLLERTHQLGMEIIIGKGSTEFGIGAAAAELCKAVLYDERKIFPVSAYLDGEYGEHDLMTGVPAIIGKNGVEEIMLLQLSDHEKELFHRSCEVNRLYNKKADER